MTLENLLDLIKVQQSAKDLRSADQMSPKDLDLFWKQEQVWRFQQNQKSLWSTTGFDSCYTIKPVIDMNAAMLSWLTSANRLGGPVPWVLALNLSLSFQDVVVIAAVPDLLLVAVLPHHSKGDEAVGYGPGDGAAHL